MRDWSLSPDCAPWLTVGKPVLVGLSGGRDSVALLLRLHEAGCVIYARHIHHGLRGGAADADAQFCEKLCKKLGIDFDCEHIDVPALALKLGKSFELVARDSRRHYFLQEAHRLEIEAIALAHHAEDQAETLLFRLARGTAGLRAMREITLAEREVPLTPLHQFQSSETQVSASELQVSTSETRFILDETQSATSQSATSQLSASQLPVLQLPELEITRPGGDALKRAEHRSKPCVYLRPLLHWRRADMALFLEQRGQDWCDDASNEDCDITRNALRHRVIPALNAAMGRDVVPIIARTASLQGECHEVLEQALDLLFEQGTLTDPQGRLFLPALEGKSPAFSRAVIHRYLTHQGVSTISCAMIQAAYALIVGKLLEGGMRPASRINLPRGWQLARRAKRMFIIKPLLDEERSSQSS